MAPLDVDAVLRALLPDPAGQPPPSPFVDLCDHVAAATAADACALLLGPGTGYVAVAADRRSGWVPEAEPPWLPPRAGDEVRALPLGGAQRLGVLLLAGAQAPGPGEAGLPALAESVVRLGVGLAVATELSQQLQEALDTRVVLEQAKGILAERNGLGVQEAFEQLRREARSRQLRVGDLAARVVAGAPLAG